MIEKPQFKTATSRIRKKIRDPKLAKREILHRRMVEIASMTFEKLIHPEVRKYYLGPCARSEWCK